MSKRSQLQKTTYYMIHLYEMSRIDKSTQIESRVVVAYGWGGRLGRNVGCC